MKIIRYVNTSDMTIEFQDEHKVKVDTYYNNFNIGQIANPYDKTTFGLGYIGEGKYQATANHENLREYSSWRNILERCYAEKYAKLHTAYADCEICDEWLNYQSYAEWYNENYYPVRDERMHIDKDILVKGNRIYSPETCLIVPQRINMIFMSKPNKYGLPSGISIMQSGKFHASYNAKRLGNFQTLEEAIIAHDTEKALHIKQVADEYKDYLPENIYAALYNWKA